MPPRVCVDLSNVCRDESLGPSSERAAWRRWVNLRTTVRGRLGTETEFFLVADTNLRRMFSRSDQTRYDQECRRGALVASLEADRTLLEDAIGAGSYVLSNDAFTDYMRLPGITELRVLRWGSRAGGILVSEVSLELPHSVLITERVEKEERKRNWADTQDLQLRWRCTNAACVERLVLVPNFRTGSAMCPTCDAYLTEGGAWQGAAQVKILWDGKEVERRTVEDGDTVIIGRLPASKQAVDVSPYVPERYRGRISRRHLQLRNDAGHILAEDLKSSNGSESLVPAEGRLRRRVWRPGIRMKPGQEIPLKRGVRVRLGGTPLVVELSGRGFGRERE